MKNVLVLRAADQWNDFRDALADVGLEAVSFPVISIYPAEDFSDCDAALAEIEQFDALVFTSANGVRYFLERMSRMDRTCDDMPAGFGLGKHTQQTMRECGLTLLPTDPALNANELAGEVCTFMRSAGFGGIEGMRFLHPCGDKARPDLAESLRAHGAIVDPVIVYRNAPAEPKSAGAIREKFVAGAIDGVAFFSPSQVEAFLALFPEYPAAYHPDVVAGAIGATTANALLKGGVMPDVVASSPDHKTFAEEIALALA